MPTRKGTPSGEAKAHSRFNPAETSTWTWYTTLLPPREITCSNSASKTMAPRTRKTEWKISRLTRARATSTQVGPRGLLRWKTPTKWRSWWTSNSKCSSSSSSNSSRGAEDTQPSSKSRLFSKRKAPSLWWWCQILRGLDQALGTAARFPIRISWASLGPLAVEITQKPPPQGHREAATSHNTWTYPNLSESTCRTITRALCPTLALRRHSSIKRAQEPLLQLRTNRTQMYLRS